MASNQVPLHKSLRLKLVLASIIIEVCMLSILVGNSMRLMQGTIEHHTDSLVEDFSPLLDAAISPSLFERDYASLTDTLDKIISKENSELKYALVYDDQNKLYAKAGFAGEFQVPDVDSDVEHAREDGVFDVRADLTIAGQKIGEVQFGIILDKYLVAEQSLFAQGVTIAAIEVLLSMFLLALVGYALTKHITKLLHATDRISEGDYDNRMNVVSEDEIGKLANNFNKMSEAISDKIEGLKRSEHALMEEKERAYVTLESIGDGVITTDTSGNIELLNSVAEKLTGWSMDEAKGQPLTQVFNTFNEASRQPCPDPVMSCLDTNRTITTAEKNLLINRNGDEFPIEDTVAPIRCRDNSVKGVVVVFRDVSGRRHMARQMAYQAKHDALTGLVNRTEFESRVSRAIASAKSDFRAHAMLYMDLDHFKIVNDTSGHFAGDELLKQLTALLTTKMRDSDTLARLGGDEFGVLLENCNAEHAKEVAYKIHSTVNDFRFKWEDRVFEVGISVGLVPISKNTDNITTLLSEADVACYIAKEQGRNRIHIHSAEDEEHDKRKNEMKVISDILLALEEERFSLYHQKIIPIVEQENDESHCEVLVRMIDEEGRVVLPYAFIPAAERYYLMPQIDRKVVSLVVEYLKGHRFLSVNDTFSINLSGQSLADETMLDFLTQSIRESKIEPRHFCFEVTETSAIRNLKQASHMIAEIKALGCSFSLDDFGSGLSSFAYLKNLDVDYLKIDGGFVIDMLESETDASMVEAINHLGHVMGLKTIAEYVENDAILQKLKTFGVDYAQGFGIHTPQPLNSPQPLNTTNVSSSETKSSSL